MNEYIDKTELQPSKTQRKLEMHALQALGKALTILPKQRLQQLGLPEKLLEAILEYQRIRSNGALKRQLQYIGRLMREVDPTPIREQLAIWQGTSDIHNAWLHRVENLRESLMTDDHALQMLLNTYPDADSQQLRTLIRNARKEKEAAKPPKHYRELFQTLKTIIPEPDHAVPDSTIEDNTELSNE